MGKGAGTLQDAKLLRLCPFLYHYLTCHSESRSSGVRNLYFPISFNIIYFQLNTRNIRPVVLYALSCSRIFAPFALSIFDCRLLLPTADFPKMSILNPSFHSFALSLTYSFKKNMSYRDL
jgi:hypothetical protein